MKLLCDSTSGQVLARISDDAPIAPIAGDGQLLVMVPDTVAVPDAVVRVVFSEEKEPEFVIDSAAVEQQWIAVKTRRNDLLKASDWVCSVMDYVAPNKDAWIVYRQALRDITKQPNPFRVMWPTSP